MTFSLSPGVSQGMGMDSASRVQSSGEVRAEMCWSPGDWSLLFGNIFIPLGCSSPSPHRPFQDNLVLIPKGSCDVLFSDKQTFHLTMVLSTSIFHAVKAPQASTFRHFHLCVDKLCFFPEQGNVVVPYIENKEIFSFFDWLKFCAPAIK